MAKRIRLEPAVGLNPEVAAFLEQYVPRNVSADRWELFGDFTISALSAGGPPGVASARSMVASVIRLCEYTDRLGQPMEVEVVFDPDHIESFIAVAKSKKAAAFGIDEMSDALLKRTRSDVERLGRAINPTAPWEPDRESLARTKVKPPHSLVEERDFFDAARRSRSVHHLAVVTLGFGCGLDGRWQPRITHEQVELREGIYWIHADQPDRWIPLPLRYHDDMGRVLATAPLGEPLIGGDLDSRLRTSRVTDRLSRHTPVRLEPARMRSSWFVRHINARTDLPFLLEMAGLTTMTTIWELLAYAKPVDLDVAVRRAVRA
jgi:hypothetical protein